MDGYAHTLEVRVRFVETDAQGIAHNAAYLVWFEVGRVDYLARHAGGYRALRESGIEALVTESHVRYGAPARFDDVLRIHVRCVDVRGARFRYEYLLERDGERVADGWTRTRPWTRRRSGRPGSPRGSSRRSARLSPGVVVVGGVSAGVVTAGSGVVVVGFSSAGFGFSGGGFGFVPTRTCFGSER